MEITDIINIRQSLNNRRKYISYAKRGCHII